MNKTKLEKLKLLPKARCNKCHKFKSYLNPLEKCDECKKKYCYDHIWGGQYKRGIKKNQVQKNICANCKKKLGYKSL